jgi:hypothetical protein
LNATNINTTLASSWAGICIANIITNLCANVYRDSSGSILSNNAKSLAITQTYEAISAAYTAYTTSLSAGATIAIKQQ